MTDAFDHSARPVPLVEVCVTTPHCAARAAQCGADRLELCAALEQGGLTPSLGLTRASVAAAGDVPVRVMIRPRSGGFNFDSAEISAMEDDIRALIAAGAEGIVIGALRDDALDLPVMRQLIAAADGAGITLHRAFDLCADPRAALEQAVDLGIDCILTSGGAPSAPMAADALARLVEIADGRLRIMAGGGVTPDDIPEMVSLGIDALHGSFSAPQDQGNVERIGISRQAARVDATKLRAAITNAGQRESCA